MFKKNPQSNKKCTEDLNRHFSQRHTDWLMGKNVFSIINHQGNPNQNPNKMLPHTCYKGYCQKENK